MTPLGGTNDGGRLLSQILTAALWESFGRFYLQSAELACSLVAHVPGERRSNMSSTAEISPCFFQRAKHFKDLREQHCPLPSAIHHNCQCGLRACIRQLQRHSKECLRYMLPWEPTPPHLLQHNRATSQSHSPGYTTLILNLLAWASVLISWMSAPRAASFPSKFS